MDTTRGDSATLGDLIIACAAGDARALKELYELEASRLYGIALRITRRPATAAEALQDAFLQIWRNAQTFDVARGSAAGWLTSIVRYRALDLQRRTRETTVEDIAAYVGETPDLDDPLALLERARAASELRRCLEVLDHKNRQSIVLAFVDGFSHSEISARLDTPLGTVKSWIKRGLAALKSCLDS